MNAAMKCMLINTGITAQESGKCIRRPTHAVAKMAKHIATSANDVRRRKPSWREFAVE